jgi:hypothetical protein
MRGSLETRKEIDDPLLVDKYLVITSQRTKSIGYRETEKSVSRQIKNMSSSCMNVPHRIIGQNILHRKIIIVQNSIETSG